MQMLVITLFTATHLYSKAIVKFTKGLDYLDYLPIRLGFKDLVYYYYFKVEIALVF